jgi:tetratricopeptide (TPR) repeat protein
MTLPNEELLNRAIDLHKMGDLAGAIGAYETFLKTRPQHPGVLNLLGLALFQSGKAENAVPLLETALAVRPDLPGAAYNLGIVLCSLNRYAESVVQFENALKLSPCDFEAHNNLAGAQMVLANNASAAAHFEKALALRPNYTPAHVNFGKLLLGAKDFTRAASHFKSALALEPEHLQAHFGLAHALRELKLTEESLMVCERVATIAPDNADARWWYGAALYEVGRFREAITQHKKATALRPGFAVAHFDLAVSYYALHQYDEACHHCQLAVTLDLSPELKIKAQLMTAWALQVQKRYTEADRIFDKIILEHGENPHGFEARKSKGMMYLNIGNFAEGWPLYNYRLGSDVPDVREARFPRWDGCSVHEKIWVWSEQGLGDQILHASMIGELQDRASSIILEVDPRLVDLFARSFPMIRVVAQNTDLSDQKIRFQISIANLGYHFRPDWASFPKREKGYLSVDPARITKLRSTIAGRGKKIVGISWRSVSKLFGGGKSAQLEDFVDILQMPELHFVDLQYGDTSEERASIQRNAGVAITHLEEVDNTRDIDGLAALISACDAVVTVSNTTAHLAGALGRPTWVFVPYGFAQIWYWFAGKTQSPWYPRVQVIHQTEGQSWKNLITLAAGDIANCIIDN